MTTYRQNIQPVVMQVEQIINITEKEFVVILTATGKPAHLPRAFAEILDPHRVTVPRWLYKKLMAKSASFKTN